MHKPTRVASMAKGKHKAPVHDKNIGAGLNPQNMQQQPLVPFTNGVFRVGSRSSLYPTMQTPIDTSVHATRVDLFTQQPNVGSMGMMIPGITGPTIGNPSGPSSGNVESNLKIPSQKVLDPGISSFGSLGQMPRSLSMLDLSADFSVDDLADISAFLTTDGSELDLDILECNGSGQHQDPTRAMQDSFGTVDISDLNFVEVKSIF